MNYLINKHYLEKTETNRNSQDYRIKPFASPVSAAGRKDSDSKKWPQSEDLCNTECGASETLSPGSKGL